MQLSTGPLFTVYVPSIGRNINCHAEIMAVLEDQPMRRMKANISAGGSTMTPRWRFAGNVNEIGEKLVSCEACLTKLFQCEIEHFCNTCAFFDLNLNVITAIHRGPILSKSIPVYPYRI